MRFLFFLIVLGISFGCSLHSKAQSKHVYEDSSILYPGESGSYTGEEPIIAAPAEDQSESSQYSVETTIRDTTLVSNRNFLSPDSIKLLKEEKQFAYAKSLDSLLKDMKAKELEKTKLEEEKRAKRNTEASPSPVYDDNSKPSAIERFLKWDKLEYILWALAGLFVVFIIYKLFLADGTYRKANPKSNVKIEEEEELKPVQGKNFDTVIAKAVSENNYRLAVRYLYLQLLQRLSAAGAIEFAVDKTNTEYLRELSGKPYKETVAELTRYYDYVWYGEFEMDAALYAKVENKFRNVVI